jgi:hypothetical protein
LIRIGTFVAENIEDMFSLREPDRALKMLRALWKVA